MARTLHGSCLCGSLKYQIDGDLFMAAYCHCSMCRKAHGSAFRPRALVWSKDFQWLQGRELLRDYISSPGAHRAFCSKCGSPLIAYSDQYPTILNLALGTLDDDPGVRAEAHWHVSSKAPWFDITDNLPQYPGFPPMPPDSAPLSQIRQDGPSARESGDV
jgi:hypothetical protein